MKNWLKKNWPIVAIWFVFIFLVYANMESCIDTLNSKSQIRQLNKSISEKEKSIEDSEVIIGKLREEISERDESIAKRDGLIREKDGEIAVIRKEKDVWKGKVEEMTPSEVVIETRKVLNVKNIFERVDGILFSLECARINLRALRTGEFSLAMEDIKKLKEKISLMDANMVDLRFQIIDLKEIVTEREKQLADEQGISADWKDKFTLCEGEKKKARKKGRKEGTIIGGIIGGIIGFFLGR